MSVDPATGLEAVRPWLSTGLLAAILLFLVRFAKPIADYLIEMRRLNLQEKNDERAGYGPLIDRLEASVARLDDENRKIRADHRQCEDRLSALEAQLEGVHRQLVMQSAMGVVSLPPSEAVKGAAERAIKEVKGE